MDFLSYCVWFLFGLKVIGDIDIGDGWFLIIIIVYWFIWKIRWIENNVFIDVMIVFFCLYNIVFDIDIVD